MPTTAADRRRRRIVAWQRWVLNPPMKMVVRLGLSRGLVMVETRGRRTDKRRRVVVGADIADDGVWVIAEHGRKAAWVANVVAHPDVRVRVRWRWRDGTARVLDDDDAAARLEGWGRPGHQRAVERFSTDMTTVHISLT